MSTLPDTPDPACVIDNPPPASVRPDDLLPIREAAVMVDRGYSTLRAWVRAGELRGYHEDPDNPYNSKLMVSRSELFAFMAASEKSPAPGRPPRELAPGAAQPDRPRDPAADDASALEIVKLRDEVKRLHLDIATLRADMRVATASREGADALVEAVRGTVAALEGRITDLLSLIEVERARTRAAEAERDALKTAAGMPWWRRLLPAPPAGG